MIYDITSEADFNRGWDAAKEEDAARIAALEAERDAARAMIFELMDAPHYDHFEARTSDGEMAAVEKMRKLSAARAVPVTRETWECPHCGGYENGGLVLTCSGCGRTGSLSAAAAKGGA